MAITTGTSPEGVSQSVGGAVCVCVCVCVCVRGGGWGVIGVREVRTGMKGQCAAAVPDPGNIAPVDRADPGRNMQQMILINQSIISALMWCSSYEGLSCDREGDNLSRVFCLLVCLFFMLLEPLVSWINAPLWFLLETVRRTDHSRCWIQMHVTEKKTVRIERNRECL